MIALPLQKQARARGNSVFLDDELEPYADQWKFLASLQRISVARVEALVQEAEPEGKITGVRTVLTLETDEDEPWTAPPSRRRKEPPISGPLPETLDLVLADQLYVAKETLVPALRNRLLRLAAFQNPEFYQAQAMRLPTYDRPRIISCAEDLPQHLALPRGCLAEVQALLEVWELNLSGTTSVLAASPLYFLSRASCGQNSNSPRTHCSRTTRACFRPPPLLARPFWPPG